MPLQQGSARARQRTVLLVGIAVLLAALVLAVVLASLLTHGRHEVSPQMMKWKDRGTTKNLQEVILGRCYNYITAQHPELGDKDCQKIWDSLKDAFIYKNPCNITPEDYQPLMELASHPVPCNKSLFWSKTGDLAHRYTKSNQNFLTLEDTLLGYMADKISWCGDPSAPGINYESCPKRSECESNPGSVFWKMASKMFAEAACGVVQVMLNGSVEAGAFRSSSIFGSVEVFNLDPDKVSEVHIWLMQDIGGPQSESCSGHSIQRLTSILEERNFKIICEDNYREPHLKIKVSPGWKQEDEAEEIQCIPGEERAAPARGSGADSPALGDVPQSSGIPGWNLLWAMSLCWDGWQPQGGQSLWLLRAE